MLHISKCFNQSITNIQSEAVKLHELQKVILNYLPNEMQNTCKIASFNNGCLILNVDDAVWASQLRFMLPEIRDNLRKNHNLYQLSSIKISINREKLINQTKKNHRSHSKPSPWSALLKSLLSNTD